MKPKKQATSRKAVIGPFVERLMKSLFFLCSAVVILVTLLIILFLFREGLPDLMQVPLWDIFTGV
ncbi:hypothetical protein FDZ71_14145, partial [bacterium]